jgi:N-acetylneuraminic acid mutarotase
MQRQRQWQWQRIDTHGSAPEPRIGHTGMAVGSRIFVFGGRNFQTRVFATSVHCYDVATRTWGELHVDATEASRTGHSAMGHTDGIMFFGGLNYRREFRNDTHVLDLF